MSKLRVLGAGGVWFASKGVAPRTLWLSLGSTDELQSADRRVFSQIGFGALQGMDGEEVAHTSTDTGTCRVAGGQDGQRGEVGEDKVAQASRSA